MKELKKLCELVSSLDVWDDVGKYEDMFTSNAGINKLVWEAAKDGIDIDDDMLFNLKRIYKFGWEDFVRQYYNERNTSYQGLEKMR